MILISRDEARSIGAKRYFTGEPCRNGHFAERLVSNNQCQECYVATRARFEARHPDRVEKNRKRQNSRLTESGYFRFHYSANVEKRKAQARMWYADNKERALAVQKAWCRANPDKVREIGRMSRRSRRARLAGAEGSHSVEDLNKIFLAQRGRCAACLAKLMPGQTEVDHITPLVLGGGNGPENLQYLCLPCNRAKGGKDPIAFAQSIGLLL